MSDRAKWRLYLSENDELLVSPDGFQYNLSFLGEGASTIAYKAKVGGGEWMVFAVTHKKNDVIKDILVDLTPYRSPYLPEVAYEGIVRPIDSFMVFPHSDDMKLYSMPLYKPLKGKKADKARKEARILNDCLMDANQYIDILSGTDNNEPDLWIGCGVEQMEFVLSCIDHVSETGEKRYKYRKIIPKGLVTALDMLIDKAYEYDIRDKLYFEFNDENLAMTANGQLILLDVIFNPCEDDEE